MFEGVGTDTNDEAEYPQIDGQLPGVVMKSRD
jgi:hypothetical protein